jgi:hypothetical protein
MSSTRVAAAALALTTAVFALTGCTTEARAERKGKEFGDQVCAMRNASSTESAQRHLSKANDKLSDLNRFVGRDVRQDVNDLDRNLSQLANDVAKGHNVREQDVNAIARSVESAISTTSGSARAAYQGILEGLNACT